MSEEKKPSSAVQEARRLREEAAAVRKAMALVLERLREERAAMRKQSGEQPESSRPRGR
jgi:hypothetical protein